MTYSIQKFFKYGLDRDIPELIEPSGNRHLNIGPGDRKIVHGTIGVGKGALADIDWWHPDPLPFSDNTVNSIHAYQFLEHFNGEDAIRLLRECERVLVPGGVMFITTPYFNSQHQSQALDHKSQWSEETWDWLFGNEYYQDHGGWKLKVHACFLMAVVYRNLDLFTQLVKDDK